MDPINLYRYFKLKRGRKGEFSSLFEVKNCHYCCRSADHILDVSNNIITTFNQLNPTEKQYAPIILNCISGGTERSGVITLAISAILATQMKKPTLLSEYASAQSMHFIIILIF